MSNTALAEIDQELRKPKPVVSPIGNRPGPKLVAPRPPLFVDCLLEPAGWQSRQRRLTAMLSLALQLVGLGILILIPLMFTNVLPPQQLVTLLIAPPPPPPPPPPPAAAAPVRVKPLVGEIASGHLIAPTRIPNKIRLIKEDEAPPSVASFGVIGGVPGGVAGGQLGGVLGGIISSSSSHSVGPPPVAAAPKRLRISQGVSVGQLIARVQPEYPTIAKAARIQGTVVLNAWITKEGTIERLTVVSGHPMLVKAALDAVQQWRYRPFTLNGEPIQVETAVTVTFSMTGEGQ